MITIKEFKQYLNMYASLYGEDTQMIFHCGGEGVEDHTIPLRVVSAGVEDKNKPILDLHLSEDIWFGKSEEECEQIQACLNKKYGLD